MGNNKLVDILASSAPRISKLKAFLLLMASLSNQNYCDCTYPYLSDINALTSIAVSIKSRFVSGKVD